MSFLINDPAARLSVQPATLKQVGVASPQALQAISQVLITGKTLEVVINQEKKTGQRGFFLFGQFIPAAVPESVRNGERLHVRVTDADDSLILKIVAADENSVGGEPAQPLGGIVSRSSMRNLRAGARPAGSPLNDSELKQIENSPATPPEIKSLIKSFFSLIDGLARQKSLLAGGAAAGNPESLAQTLAGMVAGKDRKEVRRQAVERKLEIEGFLERLENVVRGYKASSEVESLLGPLQGASTALTQLQRALDGRDLLDQLNIVMGKFGQSSFVLLPAYVDGTFANWELQYDPRELEEFKRFTPGEQAAAPFFNLHLFLNFSALGAARADLAVRPDECLVLLTLSNKEAADQIAARFPALEKSLKVLGYTSVSLQCRHGEAVQVTPPWLAQIAKFDTTT